MQLYHVLPRHRLEEKREYARSHDGRLQLTTHEPARDSAEGALPRYLHCLPNLVGGIDFSARMPVSAIRLTLAPDARIVRLRGSRQRGDLDLEAAARDAAVLHVMWDEPGLRFQEWLLVDETAVVEWTDDPDLLARDFHEQLDRLCTGRMRADAFFYPDLDPISQVPMARLIGHRLGLCEVDDPEVLYAEYRKTTHRIGAEVSTSTKHLFFVGTPFIELASRAALPRWRDQWPLVCITGEAPWGDIDQALTDAAREFSERIGGLHGATGPLELHLADLRAEADAPARFVLGMRCPSQQPVEGLHIVPARPNGARAVHRGPLWELERRVKRLVAGDPQSRAIVYVFHQFHGARSPENVLGLAAADDLPV